MWNCKREDLTIVFIFLWACIRGQGLFYCGHRIPTARELLLWYKKWKRKLTSTVIKTICIMQILAAFVVFIQLHCLKSMKRRICLIVFCPIVTFKFYRVLQTEDSEKIITLGIYWFLSKLRGIINVSFCNILQPSLYFMTIWSILSSEFYIAIIEKFIVIYVKEMRACSSY